MTLILSFTKPPDLIDTFIKNVAIPEFTTITFLEDFLISVTKNNFK